MALPQLSALCRPSWPAPSDTPALHIARTTHVTWVGALLLPCCCPAERTSCPHTAGGRTSGTFLTKKLRQRGCWNRVKKRGIYL
ncbi:hypothetical protein PENSPDRAFT_649629 [Peniophora sp. CONT]|nr:hypothetical protein PENSPDRAFT_649629 [Peniophora sp. CONT]